METHSQPKLPRRLAAVLVADVQGYSRLIGDDEDTAHRETTACIGLFGGKVADYGGRLVRAVGDGALVELQSASEAVKFAVDMQETIEERNLEVPVERRVEFRIGINLGDVIIEEGDIFGDTVNVAARLQTLAYPGGICISKAVHGEVSAKLGYGYESMGPQDLKNIVRPVEVFRVRFHEEGIGTLPTYREEQMPLEVPERPSVAVLPFKNMGDDTAEYYLADGITEDITIALSRFRELFVIARQSAFVYKSRPVSSAIIGRELGVRYLVEGGIRHHGKRLRITTQLIDTASGQEIWGERYDHYFDELFDVLDELTDRIASTLARQIQVEERRRVLKTKAESVEAYGLVLQGQELLFLHERHSNAIAREYYQRAVELDHVYARAYAAISRTHNFDWRYSWSKDAAKSLDQALDFAEKAIQLDNYDARGFAEVGFVQLYKKDHDASIAAYERALDLNPNDADVLAEMGDALSYAGEDERAVELLKRAMRLNPFYPDWYLWYLGEAYFHLGDFEDAIKTLRKMRNPSEGHRLLASSYAHLGEMKAARYHAKQVMKVHPNFSIAHWRIVPPYKHPEHLEVFIEGLRKAGLK
jgi:TolB-like protein/Flp pilus assembly protein TadD